MEENTNNETIIGEEENGEFKPRFNDSTGETANRRRIKILQQVGDVMIVEITNETDPEKKGTALTAELMNEFEKRIFDAEKTAAIAKERANKALDASVNDRGTVVKVGGVAQATFEMDEKADKAMVEKETEALKQKTKSISESFILTEVKVEENNGVRTFIF